MKPSVALKQSDSASPEPIPRRLPAPEATKDEWAGWARIVRPDVGTFPSLWLAPDGQCVLERSRHVFPISLRESVRFVAWLHSAGGGLAVTQWLPWLKALESELPGECRSMGQMLDQALEVNPQTTDAIL